MTVILETLIPKFLSSMYQDDTISKLNAKDLVDMFHENQIKSKYEVLNACNTFNNENIKCLYIGSWMGFLTHVLIKEYDYTVSELELDNRCGPISYSLNKQLCNYTSKYDHHFYGNANHQSYHFYDQFDLIINLSTEHMTDDWFSCVPAGKMMVIQSNNFSSHKDHINCVENLDLLKAKFDLSEVTYQSSLKCDIYDRYTIAGIK